MKFMLLETFLSNGKKAFYNERQGSSYLYIAEDENQIRQYVDKKWIVEHKDYILNVGVSRDGRIYPVEKRGSKLERNTDRLIKNVCKDLACLPYTSRLNIRIDDWVSPDGHYQMTFNFVLANCRNSKSDGLLHITLFVRNPLHIVDILELLRTKIADFDLKEQAEEQGFQSCEKELVSWLLYAEKFINTELSKCRAYISKNQYMNFDDFFAIHKNEVKVYYGY